jgi:nucleoside-diphosphate-sugar epimerase
MADVTETNEEKSLTERSQYNIFLTDGTTPIARTLTQRFTALGHRVTAMTHDSTGASQIRADGGLPVFADPNRMTELRGMLQMSNAHIVIHTAPQNANQAPFLASDYSAEALQKGTQTAVQAAKEAGVTYFVHLSYAFLYGNTQGHVADETAKLPKSDDALIQAGKAAEADVHKGGIPYCILRAGYVYSPDSSVLQKVDATIKAARSVNMGGDKNFAAWISVHDLADLIERVITQQPNGEIINAVDDTPTTPKDFLNYLISAQGVHPFSPFVALIRAILPSKAVSLLELSTQVSNTKAKEQLGWSPKFASYQEGIDDLLMTWRANFRSEAQ